MTIRLLLTSGFSPMGHMPAEPPLLDAAHADFIRQKVSMAVASRSTACVPSLARAYGCRISSDRLRVTVFVNEAHAQPLLADLRAGGALAAVFSRPSTHETLQLKATRAEVVPLADGDLEAVQAYTQGFDEELSGLGFSPAYVRAMGAPAEGALVAVRFAPDAAFVQTPGPNAGTPLAPAS
jgi:hypothetical protein